MIQAPMEAPGSVVNCLIASNKKLTPLAVLRPIASCIFPIENSSIVRLKIIKISFITHQCTFSHGTLYKSKHNNKYKNKQIQKQFNTTVQLVCHVSSE